MLNFSKLRSAMQQLKLTSWYDEIEPRLQERYSTADHGDFARWQSAIEQLPDIDVSAISLNTDTVSVNSHSPVQPSTTTQLSEALQLLHPWRKGPFQFFNTFVDTEWRSDWKWQRLANHITPLANRTTLDIGCGSGYHLWRMLGEGASLAIGVEPSLLFSMQYLAFNHYVKSDNAFVVPIGVDDLPSNCHAFDSVFSMGILYHRPSPVDHLLALKGFLKPGGELVLETLVIDEEYGNVLFPDDRYALMRNVWFIPTCALLEKWLKRCGFKDVRVVDTNITSLEEQRSTEWMKFNSLADFLDPADRAKTIEGYPAPKRAIVIANAPSN